MAPSIPIAVAATPGSTPAAAVLPSTPATSAPLFRPVAALAVDRTVPSGFERHCGRLATTGANHGGARAHAATRAVTTLVLGMGRSVTPASGTLFSLSARFTAPGRGVAAFLEKLLFPSSENEFLTAIATGQ